MCCRATSGSCCRRHGPSRASESAPRGSRGAVRAVHSGCPGWPWRGGGPGSAAVCGVTGDPPRGGSGRPGSNSAPGSPGEGVAPPSSRRRRAVTTSTTGRRSAWERSYSSGFRSRSSVSRGRGTAGRRAADGRHPRAAGRHGRPSALPPPLPRGPCGERAPARVRRKRHHGRGRRGGLPPRRAQRGEHRGAAATEPGGLGRAAGAWDVPGGSSASTDPIGALFTFCPKVSTHG